MSRPSIAMDKFTPFNATSKIPLADMDIEAEYKLVQKKKSKLSAKLRRYVVAMHDYKKKEKEGKK